MDSTGRDGAAPPPAGGPPPAPPAPGGGPPPGDASTTTVQARLAALALAQRLAAAAARPPPPPGPGQAPKARYAFWETQPVPQFGEETGEGGEDATPLLSGPITPPKDPGSVRPEPYTLPPGLAWADLDVGCDDDGTAAAELAALLAAHYVADAADAFRFAYSQAFLGWALSTPAGAGEGGDGGPLSVGPWCVGVRASGSGRLVAFIGAVPARLRVPGGGGPTPDAAASAAPAAAASPAAPAPPPPSSSTIPAAEVNFLCVHRKLRSKRLAPVLIKELTRRIHAAGVWQAAYTAGVVLPRPAAVARYWHRSLDVAKLCAVGFTRLPARMTMARALRLHALPAAPATPGLRPMVPADAPAVGALLRAYLARFALAPVLSDAEVAHCLVPRPGVVHSYVVEGKKGKGSKGSEEASSTITDLVSFYTLPSTVVGGTGGHDRLDAAFQFYTVPGSVSAKALVADALVLARDTGHDVFNALDILENAPFLEDLKFGIGDGQLRYYLYNWRVTPELKPGQVGLVML